MLATQLRRGHAQDSRRSHQHQLLQGPAVAPPPGPGDVKQPEAGAGLDPAEQVPRATPVGGKLGSEKECRVSQSRRNAMGWLPSHLLSELHTPTKAR